MTRCSTNRLLVAALGLLLLPLVGCGPAQESDTADAAVELQAEADRRLQQGSWLLVRYQPDVPLEPMLAAMLQAQMGKLVVRFDGRRMMARGVGVDVVRQYQVAEAFGDQLKVIIHDEGIAYETVGRFHADLLEFQSNTSPWRGRGALQRRLR